MKVNVLHLEDRVDRYEHFTKQMEEQGIEYVIKPGIRHQKPFVGINAAHKRIVKSALINKEPMCCICEDDIEFSGKGAFDYFVKNIPDAFDLFLGCIYHGEIRPDNTVRDFSSLTLYVVHERFYADFLSVPPDVHLDRGLSGRGRFVVCNPFVCKQIDGYSDNARKVTNYNKQHMGQRKFYKSTG